MRALTRQEQRTVRIGAILVGVYLLIYGMMQANSYFSKRKAEYQVLVKEAQGLKQEVQVYETRTNSLKKLMDDFHLDPAKLTRPSVVAQASAAIQKAAMSGGVVVGAVRESPARPTNKELGSLQLEAMGPVPALMKFLHQATTLGFPLVIESVQLGSEARPGMPGMPGMQGPPPGGPLKLSLTILILDFDQWKEAHA
jgi:hypothetical protein